jgi:hypothetical protein
MVKRSDDVGHKIRETRKYLNAVDLDEMFVLKKILKHWHLLYLNLGGTAVPAAWEDGEKRRRA